MESSMSGRTTDRAALFVVDGWFLNGLMDVPYAQPNLTQIFWAGSGRGLVNSCISCHMEVMSLNKPMNNVYLFAKIRYCRSFTCNYYSSRKLGCKIKRTANYIVGH